MPHARSLSPRTALVGLLSLFCMLLWLKNAPLAQGAVQRGIALILTVCLPSLFPFAVLSECLRATPLTHTLLSLAARPVCRLLRLGKAGGTALLLGLLCGAPVGAQSLVRALEEGRTTREECARILGITTVPSAAFLIGAVGEGLFSSAAFGCLLLCAVLLSAMLSACLFCRGGTSDAVLSAPQPPRPQSPARIFSDAVRTGAKTMLTVSAFILFFCVLSDTLSLLLSPLPPALRALSASLLELTAGAESAASVAQKMPAACLTAFAAGWSGLSVHCQILSVCDGKGISLRLYFLCKATEGLLSALLVFLALTLFPSILMGN